MVDKLISLELPFDSKRQIVAIIATHDVLAIGFIFELYLTFSNPYPWVIEYSVHLITQNDTEYSVSFHSDSFYSGSHILYITI